MHEIICPHCSKAFKIDEAGYADILKQVRDGECEQQLHERLELAERAKCEAHGSFVTKSRWPVAFGVGTPTTGPRWRVWPEDICDGRAEVADFGMFCVFCFFTEN